MSNSNPICGRLLRWGRGHATKCVLPAEHFDKPHRDEYGAEMREERAANLDAIGRLRGMYGDMRRTEIEDTSP